MNYTTCFFHVDLDAFFASVEQLDHPEYRNKPVIVGGLPGEKRSVVSTCSYEARKYGIHSAMPTYQAYKLCPNGIYVHGDMKRYHEKSQEVMSIFKNYSPEVNQMSIDEAFLDLSGTERLFGLPSETAKRLQDEVLSTTGLTVSIGIASSRYLSKIASGLKKPKGITQILPGEEQNFMLNLPLKDVWGLGSKTRERVKQAGFFSTKDIYKASKELLISLFGNCTGGFLYDAVRGIFADTFTDEAKYKSLSEEHTFYYDITDPIIIETILLELSSNCMFRLLEDQFTSKTICIKIRYEDFTTVSIQETLQRSITSSDFLFSESKKLFYSKYVSGRGIRLLGLGLHNLTKGIYDEQGELFDFGETKKKAIEQTLLNLKKKNPKIEITKARLIKKE